MARGKKHSPEQVVNLLRQIEAITVHQSELTEPASRKRVQ